MSLVRSVTARFLSIALTAALMCALAVGMAGTASAACAATERLVPSLSFATVTSRDGRSVYQFRTTQVNRAPAVYTQFNFRGLGTYYVPVGFQSNTIYVYLKSEYVLETFNGQVRQVLKQRTYVQACSANWRIS